MALKPLPCPTVMRLFLRYEPETGRFFWRKRSPIFGPVGRVPKEGREAFLTVNHGYLVGQVRDRNILAHRAAWAIHYGRWPSQIDHVNRDRADNRLANLRECTQAENTRNVSQPNGRKGYRGVYWEERGKKWKAMISVNGRAKYLGVFECPMEACRVRDAAALEIYGQFAVLNTP